MPVVGVCSCGKQLSVRTELIGKTIRCPACGGSVRIPGKSAASEPASAPPDKSPAQPQVKTAQRKGRRWTRWPIVAGAAAVVVLLTGGATFYWWLREPPELAHLEAIKELGPSLVKLNEDGRLIELSLEGGDVADEHLEHVAHMPELRRLSLFAASVTDEGLQKLSKLKKLEALGLTKTLVTDEGMKVLDKWYSVRWVWYSESTKITPRGIARLQKVRPGLKLFKQ